MLNPKAQEWTPTGFFAASAVMTNGSSKQAPSAISCAASSKAAAVGGQLSIQATTQMQVDSDAGVTTPNGLAELACVLSGAMSADMTFEDLMFDNSSRRGSVSWQFRCPCTRTSHPRRVQAATLAVAACSLAHNSRASLNTLIQSICKTSISLCS